MSRKNIRWSKELLEPIVETSNSYAECIRRLGLIPSGGNYTHLQRNISKYNLDTSHMLHQASNQNKEFKTFDNLSKTSSIKKRMIHEFGHKCFECGLEEWMGFPIPLELEHVDGNNRNNCKENLKLLCCNCHALTPTWRGRKLKK